MIWVVAVEVQGTRQRPAVFFTVKHEAISYMRAYGGITPLSLWRCPHRPGLGASWLHREKVSIEG